MVIMAKDDVNLFERFLIMMFGLAVVLIGLYPLSRQYGGVREFFQEKAKKISSLYNDTERGLSRARLNDKSNSTSYNKKVSQEKAPNDKLTNKDREELDSLIDKVWQ